MHGSGVRVRTCTRSEKLHAIMPATSTFTQRIKMPPEKSLLCACIVWSVVLVAGSWPRERRCLNVYQPECATFFNGGVQTNAVGSASLWPSTFPNARNLSLAHAMGEFDDFQILLSVDNYCSYLLHSFLCIHYFPPCNPDTERPMMVVPCRAICEEAMAECLDKVYTIFSRPKHMECRNFPVADGMDDNVIVACPTPAIHLEFCLPFGKKYINVTEADGNLEVCVRVASTGYYEQLMHPVYVDITFKSITASDGEDYEAYNQTLVFNRSFKDDKQCFNVTVADDILVENEEQFYICAIAYENSTYGSSGSGNSSESGFKSGSGSSSGRSGSGIGDINGLLFGGALNRSSGSVTVNIKDNDECAIPAKFCGARRCTQRMSANKNTFPTNDYTYAAHVELLGVNKFSMCTAVNVRITQCWKIKGSPCPPVNTSLTIPTCDVCPGLHPLNTGEHYLIAGIRARINTGNKSIILPNNRSKGLFADWSDKYTDSMDQWIQQAKL